MLERFIAELGAKGIALWVEADKLHYRCSTRALDDGSLDILKQNKEEIVGLLRRRSAEASKPLELSLMFFASDDMARGPDKYRFMIEAAQFADTHDFRAIWVPERHFHQFGGPYPSPAVLAAALAMKTSRIRLRAGSVVLPLHSPMRVVEEWAVVDHLSGGRVDLAFAQGWNARDFVLMPDAYGTRLQRLRANMAVVRNLWRGESVEFPDGEGKLRPVLTYPRPHQADLECWMTCSGGTERFVDAGTSGANVLTALLFQTLDELAAKVAGYRRARAEHGHDSPGHVTLMLHTFVDENLADVKDAVRGPFTEYLRSSVDLWRQQWHQLDQLHDIEREEILGMAFDRYFHTAALFGTPNSCRPMIEKVRAAGVDEIACLIDFGVAEQRVLGCLPQLDRLRRSLLARAVS